MNADIFIELSFILGITVLVATVMQILKQPQIIGYIVSGIIVGPVILNLASSTETLTTFSQIGIALLLFMVGLNLNPKVIKDVGKVSLITGIGQVLFTSIIGFFICRAFGLSAGASIYVSIGLAFSSTIIIMKLLSDTRQLDSLAGRISIGFLIVQDFIAIIMLLIISSVQDGVNMTTLAIESILTGLGAMLVLFALTTFVLPRLTKRIAKSQEFLLLFSIAWCFVVATAFYQLNFSLEAGALLAGVTLSLSPYHYEISSKMKPIRDFFLILFFVLLGTRMIFGEIVANFPLILSLSAFVLIGNPIVVMILMGFMGYTKRNSFLAGLTVAQISEFSFIVVTAGLSAGHVSQEILSVVTAVGLVTFAGSTYLIMYSNKIYNVISPYLSIFEKKGRKVDEHKYHNSKNHDIILLGCNRMGLDVLESLKKTKKSFLVIDYDPDIINKLSEEGYDCRYGDVNNTEFLDEINFEKAKMVISTISSTDTNLLLLAKIKEENKKAIISVVCHQVDEAIRLYDEGATYVLIPHLLGGKHFSAMIEDNKRFDMSKFLRERIKHIEHLHKRKKHHEANRK